MNETVIELKDVPFGTTDWSAVEPTIHSGETGVAYWRTSQFGKARVRMVEHSPSSTADHWCSKGHILLCLEGRLDTELEDGRRFTLTAGMSYQVGENAESHRSSTAAGARLFVVD
jgi:quercetin dioxygenase-like cupin family protein